MESSVQSREKENQYLTLIRMGMIHSVFLSRKFTNANKL